MRLTAKQAHVLDNIERVVIKPRIIASRSTHTRYQLDGEDCTTQVSSLIIGQWIDRLASDRLRQVARNIATKLPAPARPIFKGRPFSARAVRVGW